MANSTVRPLSVNSRIDAQNDAAHLDVHGDGRFVQHQQVRVGDQGQRVPDPLGLAAGQLLVFCPAMSVMPASSIARLTGIG